MKELIVCFIGHRDDWRCRGIENILYETIENLIIRGYSFFYDGGYGAFDNMCAKAVISLKQKYPHIKLIRILAYYHPNTNKYELPPLFDGSIYPNLEGFHPKQIITERNKWIIENSDIVVAHVENTFKSGAYRSLTYARKINKPVIYV